VCWFLLYGTYFGFAEGAEKALIADLTPEGRQGTAFGYYNAAIGVGALIASIAFGLLYERFGPGVAFGTGSALAALAAVLLLALPTDAKIVDSDA
jgi:MFS family permease